MSAIAAVVTLRPATADDCRQVWLWRNDEATRRASFDSSEIPLETHEGWFRDSLERRDRRIYIVLADGRPSGVVRLDVRGRQGTVSIHLAPERRGQGLGPAALVSLDRSAWTELDLDAFVAEVKPDNRASIAAFTKAGFRATGLSGPVVTLLKPRPRGGA